MSVYLILYIIRTQIRFYLVFTVFNENREDVEVSKIRDGNDQEETSSSKG